MRRIGWLLAFAMVVVAQPVAACTFCGGSVQARQTLREHFQQSKYVAYGKLKNPRFDPKGGAGQTEFHVEQVLKADATIGNAKLVTLPKYLPIVGNTPPEYLVFCAVADGKVDPLHGLTATESLATYLAGATKLDDKDAVKKLGYFFAHLDAVDATVAADAFLEFAKAPDADIVKAKAVLDPAKVRRFLTARETPVERLGVYAMMLGLCGGQKDAVFLGELLAQDPLSDRIRENLGGFLAGLTMLNTEAGWSRIEAILTDAQRPFDQRLSAIGTVRFFQATRPVEAKPNVLRCYKSLLTQGDVADLASDDLRRWQWWELTVEVLKPYGAPSHSSPIAKRGIVRYALQAPGDEAKKFIADVRAKEPKLVERVEESLKLYEPVKK